MVPFGRPKRKMQDVQDDDISLADLPRIHAETLSRRASAVDRDDVGSVKRGKKSIEVQSYMVEDPVTTYPGDDAKTSGNIGTGVEQDTYQTRTEYALSMDTCGKSGRFENERWEGGHNEKRDESRLTRIWRVSMRHLRFVGPGLVSSVSNRFSAAMIVRCD